MFFRKSKQIAQLKKEVSSLKDSITSNQEIIYILCLEWAETDTNVKNMARPFLGNNLDGDEYGFEGVEEVVEKLIALIEKRVG